MLGAKYGFEPSMDFAAQTTNPWSVQQIQGLHIMHNISVDFIAQPKDQCQETMLTIRMYVCMCNQHNQPSLIIARVEHMGIGPSQVQSYSKATYMYVRRSVVCGEEGVRKLVLRQAVACHIFKCLLCITLEQM